MSILSFVQKIPFPAFIRRHPWRWSVACAALLGIGGIVFSVTRPVQPEYITAIVKRGDLRQTVEAVGTVASEKDLELRFRSSGIVSAVDVKEGDRVAAGQRLAALRAGDLVAASASASARLEEEKATLRALQEGTRPEDIVIAEAGVANKRAALDGARASLKSTEGTLQAALRKLETLRKEADISLAGTIPQIRSAALQEIADAEAAIPAINGVFEDNKVNDAIVKDRPAEAQVMKDKRRQALDALRSVELQLSAARTSGDLNTVLSSGRIALSVAVNAAQGSYDLIANLQTNSFFTNDDREDAKDTIAAQRSTIQDALTSLDASAKSLKDASAGYDTQIAAEQSTITSATGSRDKALADITTYETSLRMDEAQLQLKRAGARQTDIDAQAARVRQAQADLSRAWAQAQDAFLTAPVNGVVTRVNVKVGEITSTEPAVTMLGSTPYRVEMYVSEVDVPKLALSQSGSVELDAYPGIHMRLQVAQIDVTPTDLQGSLKYRVRLEFAFPHDDVRIGMKGDVVVVTGERRDALTIPRRAILEKEGRNIVRVLRDNDQVEDVPVTFGMEGEGGETEILSGLSAGETVIVLMK